MEQIIMEEKIPQEVTKKETQTPGKKVSMIPLLSWRTVFILGFGLIAGVLIALAYWLFSPTITGSANPNGTDNTTTGLLGILGMVPDGPYQSQVNIQVVSPGSEYTPLSTLQQRAEYYSAKSLSLPFFEYLSEQLSQQMPGYSANVDKLGKVISSSYNSRSELPVIKISVTAPTESEAAALAELVPKDFNAYLISEEKDKQHKNYVATLSAIDTVKTALYQAQQELNTLKQNNLADTNPDIIILKAKVDALQQALNTQISQISIKNIADIQADYNNTQEQMTLVIAKIEDAKHQLTTFQTSNSTSNVTDDAPRIFLDSKVRALQAELDRAMATMVANSNNSTADYAISLQTVQTTSQSLASAKKELSAIQAQSVQINSVTTSPEYQILQIKIDTLNTQQTTLSKKLSQLYQQIIAAESNNSQSDIQSQFGITSLALAAAKKDLSDMENQLGFDRLSSDLNLSIAQNKVNNLNARLTTLTGQLGSLVGGDAQSLTTDYLVAGNPSAPFPVLPTRAKAKSTLMMGAIAGIIIAWILWNFKWILNQIKSMGTSKPDSADKE
jgi:hypothetical protein